VSGGWRIGIAFVVATLTLFFATVAIVDFYYLYKGTTPISVRIQRWSRRYRIWSLLLITLYGALLAHFFINRGWGPTP
jgi:hypothetical protein